MLMLILSAGLMILVIGGLAFCSEHYALDNIKSKTVGDGQHGTARWATKKEIQSTYTRVRFQPELWRQGKNLPKKQGLIVGCEGPKNKVTALVDTDDIHAMMTAASGADILCGSLLSKNHIEVKLNVSVTINANFFQNSTPKSLFCFPVGFSVYGFPASGKGVFDS